MNCKESLKEYIDKDEIYQDYKQNKLMNCSDFDKFCIQHCKDIEELLEENLELEQALDDIEKICNSIPKKHSICNIEKIARCDDIKMTHYGELHKPTENEEILRIKFNELIDEINNLKEDD